MKGIKLDLLTIFVPTSEHPANLTHVNSTIISMSSVCEQFFIHVHIHSVPCKDQHLKACLTKNYQQFKRILDRPFMVSKKSLKSL